MFYNLFSLFFKFFVAIFFKLSFILITLLSQIVPAKTESSLEGNPPYYGKKPKSIIYRPAVAVSVKVSPLSCYLLCK